MNAGTLLTSGKRALRRRMSALRAAVSERDRTQWDRALAGQFLALPEVREARTVYAYLSYGTETDTHRLVQELLRRGVRVACPRVAPDELSMDFYEIRSLADCLPGFHGIPEPGPGCRRVSEEKAPLLLPGLAFTADGKRLGYGGGFYDRFLSREPEHFTAALAYPFQLLGTLPSEEHDRKADAVLTPENVIRCREAQTESEAERSHHAWN